MNLNIIKTIKRTSHTSRNLLHIGLIAAQLAAAIGLGIQTSLVPAHAAGGQITGTVFEDFNANGVKDATTSLGNLGDGGTSVVSVAVDRGVASVTVTAFDAAGTSVATTTSTASGAYTLTVPNTATGPYRIEFSALPAGYQPSFHGADNGTSVQFVPDGNSTNINFGILVPGNYCQNNPDIVTNCYRFGDQVTGPNNTMPALLKFPYSSGSNNTTLTAPYDVPSYTQIVPANLVGTTYGLAWARNAKRLYASAYFKKHAGFGPGGPGAIYVVNPATNAVVNTFTVPGVTTNGHNTADYLTDNFNTAWEDVSKTSLGGIALSPDEATLYAMNLENRTLYALNTSTGAVVTSAAAPTGLPQPAGGTCAAANTRPFAVSVYNGTGYVGVTCTGPAATDLRGYVYSFNLSTLAFSAAPVFSHTLNYPRGFGSADPNFVPPVPGSVRPAAWNPWVSVFTALPPAFITPGGQFPVYPQPLLANIAFDEGNMILGIRDRFGDQMGNRVPSNPASPTDLYYGISAGDTLRACGSPTAGWLLESNSRCGGTGAGPQNNGQGPDNGEFYYRDEFMPYHEEVSLGAVAQIPGYPDAVVATYNPIPVNNNDATFDSGFRWFNNTTGGFTKGYRVYNGDLANGNVFGKAAGLGDLAVLCDAAPIELGNRVWSDANGNGRQDPGEPGINGVVVGLYDSVGTLLVTTTTTVDGNYYFTATNAAKTQLIQPNTGYQIRIDNTTPQAALNNTSLTTPNSVAGGNGVSDTSNNAISDVRDSDAILVVPPSGGQGVAQIVYTTGGAGATNHGLDFGYTPDRYDWGDNPDLGEGTGTGNYKTLAIDAGPRHKIVPGLLLGTLIDAETDGQPNVAANGDDINPLTADDEDGVTVSDLSLTRGSLASVRVNATNTTGQAAVLCGFIDFNGNGSFADVGEAVSLTVPTGSNNAQFTLNFGTVPASAVSATYSRFRLQYSTTCSESGIENAGEVEDYPVTITSVAKVNLGNQVWFDTNDNGIVDGSEVGVPGVRVELYQDTDGNGVFGAGDTFLGFQNTIAGGYYTFTNLTPSTSITTNYLVVISSTNFVGSGPLVNYRNSDVTTPPSTSAADDGKNHGVTLPVLGVVASGAIPLTAGNQPFTSTVPNDSNWTIDFGFYKLTLGNQVWTDIDNDGLFNHGEIGTPGVTVELLNAAGNTVISTTTTDANGIYTFTNLISGTYRVRVTAPAGYVSSTDIGSSANPDNNVDSDDNGVGAAGGTITSNPIVLTPGSAGATNANIVSNAAGSTTNPTMDFGLHQLAALGDYVWIDYDKNGIQDGSPSDGKNGVTVTLYQNGVAISTTVTANDINGNPGYYLFDNLNPGTYSVTFTLPAGFNFTTPNVGDDAKDSDATPITGATGNYTLAPGQRNLTVDAGLVPIATELAGLGDYVWADLNKNGLQDANEPGVAGITVTLYNQAGTVLSTTTTNATGGYSFTNLVPGTYQVGFTLPQGFTFTQPNVGANDQIDSDADLATGRTQTVTLAAGDYNPTLDAGLIVPLAQLGDFVWNDVNKNGIQDSGETGVPGVTVTLRTPGGTVLSTTVTGSDGKYLFDNLQPGSYVVCFGLPPSYVFSPPNQGGNPATDSNADMTTGCTTVIVLGPGESNLTIDAGIYKPSGTPQLTFSKVAAPGSGTIVVTGTIITYTLVVTNVGTATANNVIVTDTVPTNTQYMAGSATPAFASGPNPMVWNMGTLAAGQSKTVSFAVQVTDAGEVRNVATTGSDETPPFPSNQVLNPRGITAVTLSAFNATVADKGVNVSWRTAIENNTYGFYVLRSVTGKLDDAVKVKADIVVAKGAGTYTLNDPAGALNNGYWLQEIEQSGNIRNYGPVTAQTAAGASPITSPQQPPNPQPSALPTNVIGGISVGANTTTSTTGAVQPGTQAAGASGPQVLAAQPAVIAPAAQAKPVTSASTDSTATTTGSAVDGTQAQAGATTTEATTNNARASKPTSAGMNAEANANVNAGAPTNKGEAVGANGAVAVARSGSTAEARITTNTFGAQSSQPVNAMPWLFGALALSVSGLSLGAAFVLRRRRSKML